MTILEYTLVHHIEQTRMAQAADAARSARSKDTETTAPTAPTINAQVPASTTAERTAAPAPSQKGLVSMLFSRKLLVHTQPEDGSFVVTNINPRPYVKTYTKTQFEAEFPGEKLAPVFEGLNVPLSSFLHATKSANDFHSFAERIKELHPVKLDESIVSKINAAGLSTSWSSQIQTTTSISRVAERAKAKNNINSLDH